MSFGLKTPPLCSSVLSTFFYLLSMEGGDRLYPRRRYLLQLGRERHRPLRRDAQRPPASQGLATFPKMRILQLEGHLPGTHHPDSGSSGRSLHHLLSQGRPRPTNQRELCSFFGLCRIYEPFIRGSRTSWTHLEPSSARTLPIFWCSRTACHARYRKNLLPDYVTTHPVTSSSGAPILCRIRLQ